MTSRTDGKVGFALGGLGGVDAHGVGFLEAARALNVEPEIITCTSGMISWVADWLEGKPLLPRFEDQQRQGLKFPPPFHWMNTLWIAAFGDPSNVRPAVWEYWHRWMTPVDWSSTKTLFDRLWPTQVYVSRRTPEELHRIAHLVNTSSIPVIFNSFHPAGNREYLHVNQSAADFLGVRTGEIGGTSKYLPVTESTVRGALWLYFHGLDENANPDGLVDGAYHRQFIVSELHGCDRIYIARPRNNHWDNNLPRNYFEVQDFTSDMNFNKTYNAELAGLRQINRLVAQGMLKPPLFHPVQLVEVEISRPYGFFGGFVEERGVFDEAFRKAYQELTVNECAVTPSDINP